MREAYQTATKEIVASLREGGAVLDCGANTGRMFDILSCDVPLASTRYFGVEWDRKSAEKGQERGLQIVCADLNKGIPYDDEMFTCVWYFTDV